MRENNHDENELEQRLRNHYQQHYAPPQAPATVWARVQPDLDKPAEATSRFIRRARWLPALTSFLIARKQDAFSQSQKEEPLMQSVTKTDQAERENPRPIQARRPVRRRLIHTLEVAIAVFLVTSLVLGWFAVTKWRNTQGNGPALYTYTSPPGEGGYDLRWTPDGKYLVFAMGSSTNHYRYLVWDAATEKVRQTLAFDLPGWVPGTIFNVSPDAHYLFIPNKQAGILKLANIMTGQVKQIYQGDYQGQAGSEEPSSATFSNDSKYIAFVGADWRIHIWDIAAGKTILTSDPTGLTAASALTWSADDKRIMLETVELTPAKPERTLQVWNAQTGHRFVNIVETPTMSLFMTGPEPGTTLGNLSPDGTRILTYNVQAGTFEERETGTLKIIHIFHATITEAGTMGHVVFIPSWQANGTRIWLGNYVWNAITGQLSLTNSLKGGARAQPFGRYIAFWQPGNVVVIRDIVTGVNVRTIDPTVNARFMFWSPDGMYLTISTDNTYGQIYNALTGKLIVNYQGGPALLSPNHRYVAVDDSLYDATTGDPLKGVIQVLPVL